ncbi:MAG: hypothetical protein WA322_10615 [Pseudolabrys sp.]
MLSPDAKSGLSLLVLSAGLPHDYQYGYRRPLPILISTSTSGPAMRDYQYFRGPASQSSRARNVQPAAAFKNNKTYFAGSVDTAPSRKSRKRNSRPALV